MDILWAAMAICAIVSVVFYVLAISWQRMLRDHAGAIRGLARRLDALETMEDPFLRRRITELIPSPLEQACIFSFQLSDRFWRETAGLSEAHIRHIREHGTFVGSIKIEVWRSHVSVALRELPPRTRSAGWQTRTIDIYSTDSGTATVLWELDLEPTVHPERKPAAMELRYENNAILLAMSHAAKQGWAEASRGEAAQGEIIFRIPLEAEQLVDFYVAKTGIEAGIETTMKEDASVASFGYQDELQGVGWQLRLHSFNGHVSSERWTTLESPRARRVS